MHKAGSDAPFVNTWTGVIAYWIGGARVDRARSTATAVAAFTTFQGDVWRSWDDPRVSEESKRKMLVRLDRLAAEARVMLDRDFEDGLRHRLGTWIAPQALVDLYPRDGDPMYAFALMRDLRRAVTPSLPAAAAYPNAAAEIPTRAALVAMTPAEMPDGWAVCEGCTIVFEPKRKAHARYCRRCEKTPPARASFLVRDPTPGATVPVRVPKMAEDGSLGWRTIHVACCAECARAGRDSRYFLAVRKDAKFHPGGACEQKHRRRAA